jgi:ankyrin repeat protein
MRFLVAAGAKMDAKSLLRFAESGGAPSAEDVEMLELLLPAVTDIDVKVDGCAGSLIHCAVTHGKLAVVKALTSAGANVNALDDLNYPRTPLFIAIESDRKDIVDFLLAHGAAVRAQVTSVRDPGLS